MSRLKAVILLLPFQFMFGLIYAWGGIAPVIHAATGWPVGVLDFMFSLTPLVLLPAVLLAGRLVGRFAPEAILQWALVCFAVGAALALTSDSPVLFAVGYAGIALGVGGGLSTPACVAVIHRVAPQASGRLSGALLAIYGLSGTVSAPLFLLVAHLAAWRVALALVMAVYGVAGVICLMLLRAHGGAHESLQEVEQKSAPESTSTTPAAPIAATRPRLPLGVVAWNIVLLFAAVPFGSAVFAAVGRLATGHGHTVALGVAGASVMSLSNGVGRFAGGLLSDLSSPRVTWCIVLALAACGYGAALADARWGSSALFLLFAALTGLSFGALAGKLPALAAHTLPANPAWVFSLYFGAFALGSFGGPFLSAILSLSVAMTVFGATLLVALVMCAALAGVAARPRVWRW